MPLTRSSLYAQGENLHIAVWPGSIRNTADITRFIARESRSFVVSASGLLRKQDIPATTPFYEKMIAASPEVLGNGGSCLAGPEGNWIIEPVVDKETLLVATIDHKEVRRERQNFDPCGHYSRPDVVQLKLNRKRQSTVDFEE
jgi:nitrilase